ncbi:MAG: chemotaxis protein CheB [Chryseolinea sp.]
MIQKEPHHIIAIGASAGGMEEINQFFENTPLDGVAYVVIQHLSSDFKSRMVELLSRHSKLEVLEAQNGLEVMLNKVYLIPNNRFMTIDDGKLYLTEKDGIPTPHLTINKFLTSLSTDFGDKAIAVILSGLGTDGTEGVRAIKKEGGMIIARNPETTPFSSMPATAIATGLVDFVLEPNLMPNAIEDYIAYGELSSDSERDEKCLPDIVNLIKEMSPLDFTDYKHTTILRRTKRRAAYRNFSSLENYLDYLKSDPEEIDALGKDFLISVTSFFRDKEVFQFIEDDVLPDFLTKVNPNETLKMWVAGCATGEEVYTLAIIVAEQLVGKHRDLDVKIFATDVDTASLTHAGKAVYGANITKDVTPERLEKFFTKEGENYRVKPAIRKMVILATHDMAKNPPYCNMHLISCRNVLIYMTPILQKKIFSMLLFGLRRDGYLLLGSSENPMPIIKNLEVVNSKLKIYKNLEAKRVLHFESFLLPELLEVKSERPSAPGERDAVTESNTLTEAVNSRLIEDMGQLVICIDENHQVVKTYGDTRKYLLQKNFNTKLEEVLPLALGVAFKAALDDVTKTNKKSVLTAIPIFENAVATTVTLSVIPLTVKREDGKLLMVLIKDEAINPMINTNTFDETKHFDQYTISIEEELREFREKLKATHEQLDASYENMQSFNEELLSANEEMQSTNEEMQSVNEELDAVNFNYQQKNKELLEINDDLNNYFRSNINGQLFVNSDLRLIKFSPGTVNQINLQESDIGRPLSNISTNIKFETIIEDVKEVIAVGNVITKEIETKDGKWYQIMTMPYISQTSSKDSGAIITFNDVTILKNTQLELAKTNKNLLRINSDLDNFVHVASHDLLAPLNGIEGSINLMNAMARTNEDTDGFLQIINSSVRKFRELIKDIAAIGKMESEQREMELVDVDEVINNVEWSLESTIKKTNAVIHRNIDVKHIYFSKKNLRSIVYNLVSNGIKFSNGSSPIIKINTRREIDYVVLTVEDNGIGMSKEELGRVFDMYGRLHHDIEGQGIGLFLAKKIVDAANGNILVESEPGNGSRFILYFQADERAVDSMLLITE